MQIQSIGIVSATVKCWDPWGEGEAELQRSPPPLGAYRFQLVAVGDGKSAEGTQKHEWPVPSGSSFLKLWDVSVLW